MTILNQWSTEREGNDSWLRYELIAYRDWDDAYLEIRQNHSGWNGPFAESKRILLDLSNMTLVIGCVIEFIDDFADDIEMAKLVLSELVTTLKRVNNMLADYIEARVNFD